MTAQTCGRLQPQAFDSDFGKDGFARHLFRLRFRDLKLTQRAFAERFGLSYSVIRDAEQGAVPSRGLRVIVAAIACNPAFMEAAARLACDACACAEGDAYKCCARASATGGRQLSAAIARARARGGTGKAKHG